MSNLGIGQYLKSFETEVEVCPGTFKIISSGSTLVRICIDESSNSQSDDSPAHSQEDAEPELDPTPGPSGVSNMIRYIGHNSSTPSYARIDFKSK